MLVVIVTYNPDVTKLLRNIDVLRRNEPNAEILVIDNNSQVTPQLAEVVDSFIGFDKNYGLGKAYNYAIQLAKESGHESVLLLDQDSELLDNFKPSKVVKEAQQLVNPFLLSVNVRYAHLVRKVNGTNFHVAKFIVNSGTLLNVDYGMREPYSENLFLDAIDNDYCYRAQKHGSIYVYSEVMMSHGLGEGFRDPRNLCGRIYLEISRLLHARQGKSSPGLPHYSNPLRYYLITRNSLYLALRRKWFAVHLKLFVTGSLLMCDSLGYGKGFKFWSRAIKKASIGNLFEDNMELFNGGRAH